MSASPRTDLPKIAEGISRLRVPNERQLALSVRALVERHDGDNWIRALSLNPDTARRFAGYFESLFGGAGRLPLAERELIAVVVSAENGCGLCEIHHTRALGSLLADAERAQRIALDHHLVQLSRREHALVELALQITRRPKTVSTEDLQALRDAGLSDEDILEAVETISWFNHTNRIFISLGVVPDAKYFSAR
jgi:uncharacterized peroxidase-related enzyme